MRRRLERLLANDRLDAGVVFDALCRLPGSQRQGRRLVLVLDESDRDGTLRSLQLLAARRGRALPLWAVAYPPNRPPERMPELIDGVLRRVAAGLGGGVTVTLLADRGLAWPSTARVCRKPGWHFVMRVRHQTRVRLTRGLTLRAGDLWEPGRRTTRLDGVAVFAKAGFIDGLSLTAAWEPGCRSPWLLVSDTPGGYEAVRKYCRRMGCEETFRDQKSPGLRWRDSRVNDPAHATRLLLLITLAVWLCLCVGRAVERAGLRRYDPHRRRRLSLFRLGLLHLRRLAVADEPHLIPALA